MILVNHHGSFIPSSIPVGNRRAQREYITMEQMEELDPQSALTDNLLSIDNHSTDGEALLPKEDFELYKKKYFIRNCPFYILPQEEMNRFIVDGDQLRFVPQNDTVCKISKEHWCDSNYFYTDPEVSYKEIKITQRDPKYNTPFVRDFLKALESEKKDLMNVFGIGNDEYNHLAKIAYGVLGVESEFGENIQFKLKENYGQTIISLARKLLGKDSSNSRGATQIKDVTNYTLGYKGINSDNLDKPDNLAMATMIVLHSFKKDLELRQEGHFNITDENKWDFLYYIYSGSPSQISKGVATPDYNKKIQKLKNFGTNIVISEVL